MKRVVSHELLMPQGSHFSCFAKKSNQKKATPTFALIRDLERKRGAVGNSLRSNSRPLHPRFHSKSRGRIHGDPVERILDRFAMRTTRPWIFAGQLLRCPLWKINESIYRFTHKSVQHCLHRATNERFEVHRRSCKGAFARGSVLQYRCEGQS